jgi:hypothetical protein
MNRIAFSILGLLGLGVVIGFTVPAGLAEPTAVVRGPNAEKLTALRKERRDALREAAKTAEEAYRHGVGDYASIPRIKIELLNAELDLASDRAGRVAVRERLVEQFKEIEKSVAQRVESALAVSSDLLEARAARLKAEIDLLLELGDEKRSE